MTFRVFMIIYEDESKTDDGMGYEVLEGPRQKLKFARHCSIYQAEF